MVQVKISCMEGKLHFFDWQVLSVPGLDTSAKSTSLHLEMYCQYCFFWAYKKRLDWKIIRSSSQFMYGVV